MRGICIFLALILMIFAPGCGPKRNESDAARVREHYTSSSETVYNNVTLRTDFGDRVMDFTVNYTRRPDGSGHMSVIAPELISGIEAELDRDGATLKYDGLALEMGRLPGTGLSPLESLPFIVSQWDGGYVTQTARERRAGREFLTLITSHAAGAASLEVITMFDRDTLAPETAELYVNGYLTVTAFFG